jgi:hypothetical protein
MLREVTKTIISPWAWMWLQFLFNLFPQTRNQPLFGSFNFCLCFTFCMYCHINLSIIGWFFRIFNLSPTSKFRVLCLVKLVYSDNSGLGLYSGAFSLFDTMFMKYVGFSIDFNIIFTGSWFWEADTSGIICCFFGGIFQIKHFIILKSKMGCGFENLRNFLNPN